MADPVLYNRVRLSGIMAITIIYGLILLGMESKSVWSDIGFLAFYAISVIFWEFVARLWHESSQDRLKRFR